MTDNNNHEVLETIHDLATQMDERFGEAKKDMDERFGDVKNEIGVIRKDMDERFGEAKKDIGKLRSDLIDHVARTVNNAKGDMVAHTTRTVNEARVEIIQVIKTDRERQKLFNTKILTMLERGKIARPEEAEALRELVA